MNTAVVHFLSRRISMFRPTSRWLSSQAHSMDSSHVLVKPEETHRFVSECMQRAGARQSDSELLAELLVAADSRGHYSHGLNRLGVMYVGETRAGLINYSSMPEVLKESGATAWVDGHGCLGPVVGKFCMDLAISKAKETGIGFVSSKGSNHFGITGWYSMRALKHGLIGVAMTNSSPLMVPTRAKQAVLGTNTIAVAAPALGDDCFALDMATTTAAVGKVEVQLRRGQDLPSGWMMSTDGKLPTTPDQLYSSLGHKYCMLPLGGEENTAGYKGFGLAMMVEVFCGILSGGAYGPNIRLLTEYQRCANLGQMFMALDPSMFGDGFQERLADLLKFCRQLTPEEGKGPVLVAGDPERICEERVRHEGGIRYHTNVINNMNDLADQLSVKRLTTRVLPHN